MSEDRTLRRLADIAREIGLLRDFTKGMSEEEFLRDEKTQHAVVRSLEIISEAQKGIDNAVKARHPHLAWAQIHAAGNFYRHEYEMVEPERIWDTISGGSLPALERFVRIELGLDDQSGKAQP